MKVFVTGGSGFVGAHVLRVLEAHGAEVIALRHADVDVTDARAVRESVVAFRPDAIVHCAILNDLGRLYADRRAGWDAYVGATRNLVDAANEAHARVLLVSTDWVFDGTQPGATEDTPPNPINLYGFLKAASELVVSERAERGSVARIAAVQGSVEGAPREQDAGFGYFVAALVRRLRAGERFGVWESPSINTIATPTLASEAAELMWRILERDLDGIFHCCGGESVDRRTLALRAAEVFELDPALLDLGVGPPPEVLELVGATGRPQAGEAPSVTAATGRRIAIPYDTSLDATRTAAALDAELLDVTAMLRRMCRELTPV